MEQLEDHRQVFGCVWSFVDSRPLTSGGQALKLTSSFCRVPNDNACKGVTKWRLVYHLFTANIVYFG